MLRPDPLQQLGSGRIVTVVTRSCLNYDFQDEKMVGLRGQVGAQDIEPTKVKIL